MLRPLSARLDLDPPRAAARRVSKFICERCRQPTWVANEGGRVKEPLECPQQACKARNALKLVHNLCLFSDKQLIKVQESPDRIPEGETPHAVTAFVYDALVDFVRPGDRVTLVGARHSLTGAPDLPARRRPPLSCIGAAMHQRRHSVHCAAAGAGCRAVASTPPVVTMRAARSPEWWHAD